jgi:RNA polymerase sigma factor (sigma-70 family)
MDAIRALRLSRRAKRGDEGAFAEIFRSHHQELYRYCLAILRDRDDAEDALQATMAAALRSLPGEERHVEIRPWLFRVAHNEAISLLRKRRASEPADEALVDRTAVSQEVELATRERLRSLVADLGELPERQRSAIVMRELTGLSYGEIGAALSCSEGGARQAVYEARTSLRDREEGRAMECEHVRKAISDRDGRRLRGRKLRAHLNGCDGCRGFAASISQRRLDFEALCPPLPAAAAGAMLAGMIGGGGAAAGGAAVAGGTAAAGTGLAASAAVKGASVAAAVALAAGAADVGGLIDLPNPVAGGKSEPASAIPADAAGSAEAGQAVGPGGDGGSTITSSRRSQPGEPGNAGDEAAAGSGRGGGAGANANANGNAGSVGSGSGSGSHGDNGSAPVTTPTTDSGDSSATAPGHTGSNPGGGTTSAPGQTGSMPGNASSAPGQTGSSGNSESAPGQTGSTPAATGTAGSSSSSAGPKGGNGAAGSAGPANSSK